MFQRLFNAQCKPQKTKKDSGFKTVWFYRKQCGCMQVCIKISRGKTKKPPKYQQVYLANRKKSLFLSSATVLNFLQK